ncbi:hypothetical protein HN371_24890 [Candidatus Poribacteria bacterium]|nr:hypothetical protein [Candidatus Poribacteria bacterium]MBT5712847.1 hypothetical protein [Candidatus Poribacteria bacterium]MBT7809637.1 hypothetical protein [Candidatus Poribacteria bacterium]
MRHIEAVAEDEMIAAYVRAESASHRHSGELRDAMRRMGVGADVVECPDISDADQNAARRAPLTETREYGTRRGLFDGFPTDVTWTRVGLTPREMLGVRYIDYDYWVDLSAGSRLPTDAAVTIRAGRTIFGESNQGFLDAAAALRQGETFPELILVAASTDARLVVLEGNLRLTAYGLVPDTLPPETTALLGVSPRMVEWDLY